MIYENEDDLGYWAGVRPAIDICNEIIPKAERDAIVSAAINEHEGHGAGAEDFRRQGGYDAGVISAIRGWG